MALLFSSKRTEMNKLLALLALVAMPVFASTVDAEYQITIPSSATNCVTPFANLPDPSYNCYYTSIGDFTDKLEFTVDGTTVNTFEVVGKSYHFVGQSGRAHPSYTWSTTLTNVYIVDNDPNSLTFGNIVAQLTDAPFWSNPDCLTVRNYCSPHQTDDWFASVQLSAGSYALVINGTVGGNRPGSYTYTTTTDAPPPAPAVAPVACNEGKE
jgi:hypothetical protein